jgi:Putative metallopeptidase
MNFKLIEKHVRLAALLLGLAALAALPAPASAQNWELLPINPRVEIEYVKPTHDRLTGVYERLKDRKILEELQHFLAPLRLPYGLRLRTEQCDKTNAYYSSSERALVLCYEYVEDVVKQAPERESTDGFVTREAAIVGNLVGASLHEGGHMIFDLLDVPVFGREEDAADEMASFIALQFNKSVARVIVKGWVWTWARDTDPTAAAPMTVWSDEHGTASQRMYNALCLGYGGDPKTFEDFVAKGYLPKKRADHCAAEYDLVKQAFVKTVLPFIDTELMKRIQQAEWLTPAELK